MAESTKVMIDQVSFWVEKLDNGNIRVTHACGQTNPMHGPGTDGINLFEVHPCQTRWYAYWNDRLGAEAKNRTGPGKDGEKPWWSSKSWKRGPQRDRPGKPADGK